CSFGECNCFADITGAAEYRNNSIEPKCKSPVGRCSVGECFKQESEFLLCFIITEPDYIKDFFLQVCSVYPDASRAEFVSVAYKVIAVSSDGKNIAFIFVIQIFYKLVFWHGEYMMLTFIPFFFFVIMKERKVIYPDEFIARFINQVKCFRKL